MQISEPFKYILCVRTLWFLKGKIVYILRHINYASIKRGAWNTTEMKFIVYT